MILAPATSGVEIEFISAVSSIRLLDYIDAVSVHPYRSNPSETALIDYDRLRSVVEGKTIVGSEWGYTTGGTYANRVDLVKQAQYVVRKYIVNPLARVPITIIYDWRYDRLSHRESEHNFGLVSHQWRGGKLFFIKPSYFAIYNFNLRLAGYAPTKFLSLGHQVYALWFEKDDSRKLVVWRAGSTSDNSIE